MSERVKLSELIDDNKVRQGNNRSDGSYNNLKESIKSLGVIDPITYRIENNKKYIVNGHQRVSIAKLLKLKDIPAYEVNFNGNSTAAQLSTNMARVNMRPIDCAMGLKEILEKNPNHTKEDLMALFGKSSKWINQAMTFTNLCDPLIRIFKKYPDRIFSDELMISIASASIERQKNAISRYMTVYRTNMKKLMREFGIRDWNLTHFIENIAKRCDSNENQLQFIKDTVGIKALRKLEKEKGVKHTYSNSLFNDYAEDQFCDDKLFLVELFSSTFGGNILQDLPIYDDSMCWVSRDKIFGSKQAFYKHIKERTTHKWSNIEITSWNGNVFNPYIDFQVLEKVVKKDDGTTEVVKANIDPFKNYYNKVNKYIYPYVVKHCENIDHESYLPNVNLNKTFHWLHHNHKMPALTFVDNRPSKGEYKLFTNDEMVTAHASIWFEFYFPDVTYHQLDMLFKANNISSISKLCLDLYNKDEQFRKGYVSLFNTKLLQKQFKVSGKKDEMVHKVLESFKPVKCLPFDNCLGVIYGTNSQGLMKEYAPKPNYGD